MRSMIFSFLKQSIVFILMLFIAVIMAAGKISVSAAGCQCACTCGCDCKRNLPQSDEAVKEEISRITKSHIMEDNRKDYGKEVLALANAIGGSAKNSGFTVKTENWKSEAGYQVVEQMFEKNNWMLKIQYRFGGNGFRPEDTCHPLWIYHNGKQIVSGSDYQGWAWCHSITLYEILDYLASLN